MDSFCVVQLKDIEKKRVFKSKLFASTGHHLYVPLFWHNIFNSKPITTTTMDDNDDDTYIGYCSIYYYYVPYNFLSVSL